MIYFTSDHHFGHRNIIEYTHRPFASLSEMNEELLRRWNSVVGPTDEVYHLGDMAFQSHAYDLESILEQLNGKIYYIRGNHDKEIMTADKRIHRFEWIKDYFELKIDDPELKSDDGSRQKIVLCHYPFITWNGEAHGSWHLHGHSHEIVMSSKPGQLNVCVEQTNYTPISYDQVKTLITERYRHGTNTEHSDLHHI